MARLTDKTTATAVTLSSLVHIVNTGDTSQNSTGSSYKADLGQLGGAMGGYQYYTEVAVSSAEILTLNSLPIELLPTPGVGNYYDTKIIIEYTFNTTPYVSPGISNDVVIGDGTNLMYDIYSLNILSADSVFMIQSMVGPNSLVYPNTALYLSQQGGDPTSGDGEFLVKIWYSIRTVG
jgi:hypothetical protein